jgi:hypothetical protein
LNTDPTATAGPAPRRMRNPEDVLVLAYVAEARRQIVAQRHSGYGLPSLLDMGRAHGESWVMARRRRAAELRELARQRAALPVLADVEDEPAEPIERHPEGIDLDRARERLAALTRTER